MPGRRIRESARIIEEALGLIGPVEPRPPERIDQILGNLAAYWKRNPDLRLGQIVGNFADGDPYYYEDADLLARLRRENADGSR